LAYSRKGGENGGRFKKGGPCVPTKKIEGFFLEPKRGGTLLLKRITYDRGGKKRGKEGKTDD